MPFILSIPLNTDVYYFLCPVNDMAIKADIVCYKLLLLHSFLLVIYVGQFFINNTFYELSLLCKA